MTDTTNPKATNKAAAANAAAPAADKGEKATPFASASLYVGDLHPDVTEALLFELFSQVGPVASIRVCRDAVTRRSLGYAYVNYQSMGDAERALDTLSYTPIKERPCRIMWSQRDPSARRSGANNVFVKNLDASVNNKGLYDRFSTFGNVLSCKVACDEAGKSKGYGFVHFESADAAKKAIEKVNGMEMAGKEVFVGEFKRRSERQTVKDRFTNVYVKGLAEETTDDELKELFAAHGDVTSAVVMKDDAGASKGFGFVNFAEHTAAAAAVEALNGSDFKGRALFCAKAQKKAERDAELRAKFEQLKIDRMNKYAGVNVYIKNLEESWGDDKLRELFSPMGSITSAKVMLNEAGTSKCFGFVCFTTAEEATKAVTELNGKLIGSKPLYVALAQPKAIREQQLRAQHQQRMRMPIAGQPLYPGAPVYFTQPGMPQAGRPNYVFPAQQMAVRPWGAGRPAQGARGFPQAVPYGTVPMRGGRGGGKGKRGGGRGGGRGGYAYTANARNGAVAQSVPPPQPVVQPVMSDVLTAKALAEATPEQQKQLLGEKLFPLVQQVQPETAGKVTGMLLEMDNSELLLLLESQEALHAKIDEAMQVLRAHAAGAAEEE